MRASPRRRSPVGGRGYRRTGWPGRAAGLALALVAAGWVGGAALAGAPTEARAVAGARQTVARTEVRTQALDKMRGVDVSRTPATAKAVVPVKAVAAPVAVPAKAGGPAPRPPQGGAATAAAAGRPGVAVVAASLRPGLNPVPVAARPAVHLDDQVTYQYNALGRRDPFMPLVGGLEYVPVESPPDVGALRVVGIMWGALDKFAIVEDGRGNSTVLRAGDKVMNGVVEGLKRDGVVVRLTVDGQTQSVAIPLTRKGDSNANR